VIQLSLSAEGVIARKNRREIIREATLRVTLDGRPFVTLLCLEEYLEELALGFLYNEGCIDSMDDVMSVVVDDKSTSVHITLKSGLAKCTNSGESQAPRTVTSTSAKGLTFINPEKTANFEVIQSAHRVSITEIWEIARLFSERSLLKKSAGGVHSALFHHPERSLFCEDIGRHNCIDKIAGMLLTQRGLPLVSESLLFSSGRVSTEIITKILRLKTPIYVSLTTPTASTVDMARLYNLTLIGYVRDGQAVLYSGRERVLF